MDDIDRAQEREQSDREYAISEALRIAQPPLLPQGLCYYCQSIVPPGRRFCDADCMTDYEQLKRAEKRLGTFSV